MGDLERRPAFVLAVRLSLPSAIVLASVIIALGLYFGLRSSGVVPEPMPSPARPTASTPSDEQLRSEVAAAVEGARPRWRAACWDTADPATRRPGRYVSVLAFDPAGELDVSGISEIRDGSDPVVAQCLRLQVEAFTISAPGRHVSFEVPFELP